ncbi:MAG: zinc ribbon domain-containing protein [Candidatus Bathyarchaeia archaeon]
MEKRVFKREELVGKTVIGQDAYVSGKVKDLAVTEEGKLGLLVEEKDGREKVILFDDVHKIGDVVLLKTRGAPEAVPRPTPMPSPQVAPATNLCPKCGWQNKPEAKFCIKCGRRLQ